MGSIFFQLLINGVIAGAIYSLVALGISLKYGVSNLIDFAHGALFMIGAYVGYLLHIALGLSIWIAVPLTIVIVGLLGMAIEWWLYKPLRLKDRLAPLIVSIGLAIILENFVLMVAGAEIRTLRTGTIQQGMNFLGAIITPVQVTIIIVTVILLIGMWLFLKKTRFGQAIRAVADDREVAEIVGINSNRIINWSFGISTGIAAIGGILIGIEQNIEPTMGFGILIKAFAAVIVGGIGNVPGAVVGAFFIGIVENFGIWYLPSGYKDAIAFVILILFLLFRPQGFFGKKEGGVR